MNYSIKCLLSIAIKCGLIFHFKHADKSGITGDNFVEFAQLALQLSHNSPRDIGIELTSPQGTTINILQPFTNIAGNPNYNWFSIGISGFYGEQVVGDWIIKITDYTDNSSGGVLNSAALKIYGH